MLQNFFNYIDEQYLCIYDINLTYFNMCYIMKKLYDISYETEIKNIFYYVCLLILLQITNKIVKSYEIIIL